MATNKITKAQRFSDIKALLAGEEIKFGTSVSEAIEFIDNELVLLAKKNATKSKAQIADQKKNLEYSQLILDYLSAQSIGVTCTEILQGIPELSDAGFGNQKVSALLRPMLAAGQVDKTIKKGKSLFTIR